MSENIAPRARSTCWPRLRHAGCMLHHPIAGLVALAAIIVSAALLPGGGVECSTVGSFISRRARSTGSLRSADYLVEMRPTGAVITCPSDKSWDDLEAVARNAPYPVFFMFYRNTSRLDGFWAPWLRTDRWRVGGVSLFQPRAGQDKAAARETLVQHLSQGQDEFIPVGLVNHDTRQFSIEWSGVAWNGATLAAAGVFLWSLSGVPAWWRERRERLAEAKQVCAACGYSLAGLAAPVTCPECGRARPA